MHHIPITSVEMTEAKEEGSGGRRGRGRGIVRRHSMEQAEKPATPSRRLLRGPSSGGGDG